MSGLQRKMRNVGLSMSKLLRKLQNMVRLSSVVVEARDEEDWLPGGTANVPPNKEDPPAVKAMVPAWKSPSSMYSIREPRIRTETFHAHVPGTRAEITQALAVHVSKLNELVTVLEDRAKVH